MSPSHVHPPSVHRSGSTPPLFGCGYSYFFCDKTGGRAHRLLWTTADATLENLFLEGFVESQAQISIFALSQCVVRDVLHCLVSWPTHSFRIVGRNARVGHKNVVKKGQESPLREPLDEREKSDYQGTLRRLTHNGFQPTCPACPGPLAEDAGCESVCPWHRCFALTRRL